MRKLGLILFALFTLGFGAWSQTMVFDRTSVDLGELPYNGGNVDFDYRITNTSDSVLVIYSVEVTCDCTDIKYSRRPVKKGESTTVKVTYKPNLTTGTFRKAVQIYANTDQERHIVTFMGEITSEEDIDADADEEDEDDLE
ncbi:MAG: DUF1573 domain-containing protein [Rikenellaceae bacterium]